MAVPTTQDVAQASLRLAARFGTCKQWFEDNLKGISCLEQGATTTLRKTDTIGEQRL